MNIMFLSTTNYRHTMQKLPFFFALFIAAILPVSLFLCSKKTEVSTTGKDKAALERAFPSHSGEEFYEIPVMNRALTIFVPERLQGEIPNITDAVSKDGADLAEGRATFEEVVTRIRKREEARGCTVK